MQAKWNSVMNSQERSQLIMPNIWLTRISKANLVKMATCLSLVCRRPDTNEKIFNEYSALQRTLKKANKVEDIISIPSAVNLVKVPETEKLKAQNIFRDTTLSQAEIDSCKNVFLSLPFYRGLFIQPAKQYLVDGRSYQ